MEESGDSHPSSCGMTPGVLFSEMNMSNPVTICVNCVHHWDTHQNPHGDVWYNHRCMAVPLPMVVDPVTGKKKFQDTNDLGRKYLDDNQYPRCRDINDGNCPHFQQVKTLFRKIMESLGRG